MNSGEYVDTEQMGEILTKMSEYINSIEEAINNYDPIADSLGSSSFRGKVEENLSDVKSSYTGMMPELENLRDFIDKVVKTYNIKVENISNTVLVREN